MENLPDAPEEPLPSDCCGGGCVPCVMDVYQEQLEQWLRLKDMSPSKRAQWMMEQKEKDNKEKKAAAAMSLAEYRTFTLNKIEKVTENCFLFTFLLPSNTSLGLQVGQHIVLRVQESDGSYISRQYSPISPLEQTGLFKVLIKVYKGGRMSRHISHWIEGCSAQWRGPFGGFSYKPNKYNHIGMLACGTGIAPMIQVIRSVVENEEDETFLHLLYGCRTQEDILVKEEIDYFTSFWNFTVLYSLSRTSQSSLASHPGSIKYADKVHIGRIDRKLVEQEMPSPSSSPGRKVMVLVCGTQSFNEDMRKYLKQGSYTSDMYFNF